MGSSSCRAAGEWGGHGGRLRFCDNDGIIVVASPLHGYLQGSFMLCLKEMALKIAVLVGVKDEDIDA